MTDRSVESILGFRRLLVLAPHTDDELGCAGSIARLVRSGVEAHYVALSRCEESVPAQLPPDVLEHECRAACAVLGIAPERVEVWPFRVRRFPEARQEILERFVALNRAIAPDLVFAPSTMDLHQDHATVATEAFRAFKHATVLGYEVPQNNVDFSCDSFVGLEEQDLERKLRARDAYASQSHRTYMTAELIRGLALLRGMQANTGLAEAFQVQRFIIR